METQLVSAELKDRHLIVQMRIANALERIADSLDKITGPFSDPTHKIEAQATRQNNEKVYRVIRTL